MSAFQSPEEITNDDSNNITSLLRSSLNDLDADSASEEDHEVNVSSDILAAYSEIESVPLLM